MLHFYKGYSRVSIPGSDGKDGSNVVVRFCGLVIHRTRKQEILLMGATVVGPCLHLPSEAGLERSNGIIRTAPVWYVPEADGLTKATF
jgi:hypothetical protein